MDSIFCENKMGKHQTRTDIKEILTRLLEEHGVDSDKVTCRAVRYALEKKRGEKRDAYKAFRKRLSNEILPIHEMLIAGLE